MSCCNCCCSQTGDQRPPPPAGDGKDTPPFCSLYEVVFTTINVTKSDDGFASGELEVRLTFTVSSQTQFQDFISTALQLGTTTLNLNPFVVSVPTNSSVISVSVQAEEEDGNVYSGHQAVYGSGINWGIGPHAGNLGGINEALQAQVNYSIACARTRFTAISQSALMAYAADVARKRKIESPSPSTLLTWALNRLALNGWEITHSVGDTLLFKGHGSFAARIAERYGQK